MQTQEKRFSINKADRVQILKNGIHRASDNNAQVVKDQDGDLVILEMNQLKLEEVGPIWGFLGKREDLHRGVQWTDDRMNAARIYL